MAFQKGSVGFENGPLRQFDVATIRDLIQSTHGNISAIAREMGVKSDAIRDFIKSKPVLQTELDDARLARVKINIFDPDPEEMKQALLAYDGMLTRVGKHFGVQKHTVANWLLKHQDLNDLAQSIRLTVARRGLTEKFEPDHAALAQAIRDLNGNLSGVARGFHVSRATLDGYVREHPDIRTAVDEARETMLDMAESSLYRRVLAGEGWAVMFFLKTQGRKRGYIERGETFSMNINLNNLSVEQLERLANGEHPSLVLGTSQDSQGRDGRARGPESYPLTIEGTSRVSAEEEAS